MQRTKEDVVLVSLVDHTPDDKACTPSVDAATGRVRLLVGQSWYDAIALYRHHGLVMPERTLGRFFSVGGVIANAVYGGSREGGSVHSHVSKMPVMTSDGKTSEIEGDELKYWRSSGGQLGVILAVEMKLVREADKGGTLAMKNDVQDFSSLFADVGSPTMNEVSNLVGAVAQKVYSTIAAYDHNQFFFNYYYSNQLVSFYTDFSGPPFNEALVAKYAAAAQFNLQAFGQEVAYTSR
ncbi:hypothetical protein ACHAWO_000024 [Cyclotella atomus]|uniref:FAD linked oxidase N-terminal domain-containing protein n=1 Tax=Cyclotella atomus TaxID=382360 RepID=A0ABD3PT46_9STRA